MKRNRIRPPLSRLFAARTPRQMEQEIAEDIGGFRTPGSGAFDWKGDAQNKVLLVEAKQTRKDRFALTEELLQKISEWAWNAGKVPVLVIEFVNFPLGLEQKWALVPYDYFREKTTDQANAQ